MQDVSKILTRKYYGKKDPFRSREFRQPRWMELLAVLLFTVSGLGEGKSINVVLGGLPKAVTLAFVGLAGLEFFIRGDFDRLKKTGRAVRAVHPVSGGACRLVHVHLGAQLHGLYLHHPRRGKDPVSEHRHGGGHLLRVPVRAVQHRPVHHRHLLRKPLHPVQRGARLWCGRERELPAHQHSVAGQQHLWLCRAAGDPRGDLSGGHLCAVLPVLFAKRNQAAAHPQLGAGGLLLFLYWRA